MVNGLIFDFFGTLVDYSEGMAGLSFDASYELLRSYNYPGSYDDFVLEWEEIYSELSARSLTDCREFHMHQVVDRLMASCRKRPPEEALPRFVNTFIAEWNRGVIYKDGIQALLRTLSMRYRLALVSNSHYAPLVTDHLEAMGIRSFFSAILISIEFGRRKPDRSIFDVAIRQMGLCPDDVLHIGDNYRDDFCGARNAGIACLLLDPHKQHPVDDSSRISSITELVGRASR